MKVFISWSGERSELLAKALRDWLPLVIHYIEPWLSQSDIEAGERWSIEIAKELESTNFGIICVTPENLNSPWVLFEAGALAKSMQDGRVIPLLLDLDFKNVSGPLSQFQAKKAENVGLRELIVSLNKAGAEPVPDAKLSTLFNALVPELEKQIAAIPKAQAGTKNTRPQGEILEELVSSVRTVELRFRDIVDDEFQLRKRRRPRIHPGMLMELAHRIGDDPRDPINILIVASPLKDEVPWLYEMAQETYRAIKSGNKPEADRARSRLMNAVRTVDSGSFAEELGFDRKSTHYAMRDLWMLIDALAMEVDLTRSSRQQIPGKK